MDVAKQLNVWSMRGIMTILKQTDKSKRTRTLFSNNNHNPSEVHGGRKTVPQRTGQMRRTDNIINPYAHSRIKPTHIAVGDT